MFSLVFVAAMLVTLLAFGGLHMFTHFGSGISLIGAAALGTGVFLTLLPEKKHKLELKLADSDTVNEVSQQSFNKAINDYNYINGTLAKTKDMALKQQVLGMQKTAANILHYLQQHPEKIPLARRFVDYYQDSAASILEKYMELEYTQLRTQDVANLQQRTKDMLCDLDEAYKQQFAKIISDQIMDMDAELKVMQRTMQAEGFSHTKQQTAAAKDSSTQTAQSRNFTEQVQDFMDFTQKYSHRGDNADNKNTKQKFVFYKQLREHAERYGTAIQETGYPLMRTQILKRKLIAGGLGILFGGFGAHKFYLGKTGWGVLYLIFAWTGIPFIVGFIEGIRYLFMSYDEFLFKYC